MWIRDRRRVVVAGARRIEQLCIDDGVRIVIPAKSTQKPRRALVERAADITQKESGVVRGFAGHKRVQRVERGVVPVGHDHSMQMVRTWLGQYLDAAVTQFVVFRRERILVDSYFADGRFRRQLSARKSVDIDLAAIRAGRRFGQRIQLILQLIGIVRKRVQILPLDHDRAGVVVRAGIESRTLVIDGNLLLVNSDDQSQIRERGMPRLYRHTLSLGQCKARGSYGDDVHTRCKLRKQISTIGTTQYRRRVPIRILYRDRSFDHARSRRVGHRATQ